MNEFKQLQELLNSFKFDELKKFICNRPFTEQIDILSYLSYNNDDDENNLLVYTFLSYVITNDEKWNWHFLASKVMGVSLNHIQSAERVGLYHGLKALKLDESNVDIMEYLLYYNHIPEKELSDEQAIELAKKIINIRPDSLSAKMTLAKLDFQI